jgi:tripartite-type tricarboxylate transporter receptor subunit TctC
MRKIFVAALAGIALTAAAAAPASAWPDRPVKFIVSLGPGSGVDVTARVVGDALSKKWNQAVVVENRPGGDGIVAITGFIGADDDHVLLFTPTGAFASHPHQLEKVPYDLKALAPIARTTNTIVAIGVPASLGVNNVKELLAKIKAEPGKTNFAAATATNEFLFRGYLKEAKLDMAKVPYRDTVSAVNDLGENRIQAYVGAYAIMRAPAQSGKVKILAVTNQERAKGASDVPTVTEEGEPKLSFDGLVGLFGPTKMPKELREKIAADVKDVLGQQEVAARLTQTGQNVSPGSPAEFEKAMNAQIQQVARVAKELDIKPGQQ